MERRRGEVRNCWRRDWIRAVVVIGRRGGVRAER